MSHSCLFHFPCHISVGDVRAGGGVYIILCLNELGFCVHIYIYVNVYVRLGPLKFSLQTTIDHHGPSIDSGHYTASINCCKKHSIATITKLRSLELLIKTPLLHILYYINGLTHDIWTRTGGWEFGSLPWRWHILSIPLTTGRGTSAETCGSDDVFPPCDLGSRPEALC